MAHAMIVADMKIGATINGTIHLDWEIAGYTTMTRSPGSADTGLSKVIVPRVVPSGMAKEHLCGPAARFLRMVMVGSHTSTQNRELSSSLTSGSVSPLKRSTVILLLFSTVWTRPRTRSGRGPMV